MKILFDRNLPDALRTHLALHEVTLLRERGWSELQNGELLRRAEAEFDVLLTTDSNITSQQNIPKYRIAFIVLRAFNNKVENFLPMFPELLAKLKIIKPGEAEYIYEDERLRRRDERKGKR